MAEGFYKTQDKFVLMKKSKKIKYNDGVLWRTKTRWLKKNLKENFKAGLRFDEL